MPPLQGEGPHGSQNANHTKPISNRASSWKIGDIMANTSTDGSNDISPFSRLDQPSKDGVDLWQKAIRGAKLQLPQGLDLDTTDRSSTLHAIANLAEERRTESEGSKKTLNFRNGKQVAIRDIWGSFIHWVQKFQTIGDIAIQADAGYASLPWALVRLVLQIGINEHETRTAVAKGMDYIASLITHYAILEEIYIREDSRFSKQVSESLLSLYIAVLKYLVFAVQHYRSGTWKRLGKALTANLTIQEHLSSVDRAKTEVDVRASQASDDIEQTGIKHLEVVQAQLSKRIIGASQANHDITMQSLDVIGNGVKRLGNAEEQQRVLMKCVTEMINEWQHPISTIVGQISGIEDQLTDVREHLEEAHRKEMMDWLSKVAYEPYHMAVSSARLRSSCNWLLKNPDFQEWQRSSTSCILWMHGILGSGKTHVVSRVIDLLREQSGEQSESNSVAFFYCSRKEAGSENEKGDSPRAQPSEILRCIVKQLAGGQAGRPEEIVVTQKYNQLKSAGIEPRPLTVSECVDLIISLSTKALTTIIIDALDECNPNTRFDLIRSLDEIVRSPRSHIKIFLSTRPEKAIVKHLDAYPTFELNSGNNSEDIKNFINQQLEQKIKQRDLLDGNVSDELRTKIQSSIASRAGGMFWYASLQLNLLCAPGDEQDEDGILEKMAVLPDSLKDTYARIIAEIDDSNRTSSRKRQIALNTLQWLLCAQEPLACGPFLEAIRPAAGTGGKSPHNPADRSVVLDVCRTLVVIENDAFQFAHLSVREHLEDHGDRDGVNSEQTKGRFSDSECHLTAAESCLRMLGTTVGAVAVGSKMTDSEKKFSQYASLYWPIHYQKIDLKEMNQDERKRKVRASLKGLLVHGKETSPTFKNWLSRLQTLAHNLRDNPSLFQKLGSLQAEQDTSLFTACVFGFSEVIGQLGRLGPFDFNQYNFQKQTALCVAIENNQIETVETLLPRLDVNMLNFWSVVQFENFEQEGSSTVICYASALQAAAVLGSETLTGLLLDHGARIDLVAGYYGNALQAASLGGHTELVSFLLERGAEPNSQGGFHGNALQAAAASGKPETIAVLVDAGALAITPCGHYSSALMAAICSGSEEATQALLDYDRVSVNTKTRFYGTPLQRVSDMDREDLLELLLREGADINAHQAFDSVTSPAETDSALANAAWGGHRKIVSLLLKKGAEADLRPLKFHLLHQAAIQGMCDLAEYCIESARCDINMTTEEEQKYSKDGAIMSPLSFACAEGHIDMVRLLLRHGASIEFAGDNVTTLQLAARHGHSNIINLLIDTFKSRSGTARLQTYVDRRMANGRTAVYEAILSGSVDALQSLLKHNAKYESEAGFPYVLHSAVCWNSLRMVQTVLEYSKQGALNGKLVIDARNDLDKTPLIDAAERNLSDMTSLLLDNGASYAACSRDNNTALHYAVWRDHGQIVQQLLDAYKKNPNRSFLDTRNSNKNTVLNEALQKKHYKVLKMLLAAGAEWHSEEGRDSLLHKAVITNAALVREYLLAFSDFPKQLKALIESRGVKKTTSLFEACVDGQIESAKVLMEFGADYAITDTDGANILHKAVSREDTVAAKLLLTFSKADVGKEKLKNFVNQRCKTGRTPLCEAADKGSIAMITLLLQYQADYFIADNEKNTPLLLATKRSHHGAASALLKHGAQDADQARFRTFLNAQDHKGLTALVQAAHRDGSSRIDLILFQYRVDYGIPDHRGVTALHVASWGHHLDTTVGALLNYASQDTDKQSFQRFLNARNYFGKTALMDAAECNRAGVIQRLLHHGADYYILDKDGFTALHWCTWRNQENAVARLLQDTSTDKTDGGDKFNKFLNHSGGAGQTALIDAVNKGFTHFVTLFLTKYGADYDCFDGSGNSCLHLALKKKQNTQVFEEISRILLEFASQHKIDDLARFKTFLNKRDREGMTALGIAEARNLKSLVVLLKEQGAE